MLKTSVPPLTLLTGRSPHLFLTLGAGVTPASPLLVVHGAALVACPTDQVAQSDHALADAADIELARAIGVADDPSSLRQLKQTIVDFFGRRDHGLIRKIRRLLRQFVEFGGVQDVLAIRRRANQMDLRRRSFARR